MCVVEQWDRVYQDGRREPQQTYYYCPQRNDPGHGALIQIRTLQEEHVVTPPRAFNSNTSRTAGMAEYPIIEPRHQAEAPMEQRAEKKSGKKKAAVVTKNGGYKLGIRFHIPFTRKTPKPKKESRIERPAPEVVNPPEQQTRPPVTYFRPQPFAEGPPEPYQLPRRQSFDRLPHYTAYHAEPGRPAEIYEPGQPAMVHEPIHSYQAAEQPSLHTVERRSRSRERRQTVHFPPRHNVPVPPSREPRPRERSSTTVIVPDVREESPPIFRQHASHRQRPVILTRSPSRERRPRTRDLTPAPRIPVRQHLGRMPRAPSPPRRNHSPRRLRRIEEDIQRVERALRSARQQAQLEDAERRERRLVKIERDLQTLYDQQDAEIELQHQLRVVRDNEARFQAERRDRITRDRTRPITIHQTLHRPQTERVTSAARNDFEERGTRVIDRAIRDRREERNSRDRRNERRDDRRVERRESSAHQAQRDRNHGGNTRRRNTISGADHRIWDDDRERRRRRWF